MSFIHGTNKPNTVNSLTYEIEYITGMYTLKFHGKFKELKCVAHCNILEEQAKSFLQIHFYSASPLSVFC